MIVVALLVLDRRFWTETAPPVGSVAPDLGVSAVTLAERR